MGGPTVPLPIGTIHFRHAVLAVTCVVALGGCQRSHAARSASTRSEPSSAPAPAQPGSTRPAFRIVAELPYAVELAPLGASALLITGHPLEQVPLLIEDSEVRFRPELARLNDPTGATSFVSALAGSWPDNAWMAWSASSAAGPSNADIYLWQGERGWIKKYEHGWGAAELAVWRGQLIIVGTPFDVPMMVQQQIHELSNTGMKHLGTAGCGGGSGSVLGRPWVHDGWLEIFGYQCGVNGGWPDQGGAVLVDSWSSEGTKARRAWPLPEALGVERALVDDGGPLVLVVEREREHRRLARFVDGQWRTVTDLPAGFVRVHAPGSHALWGIADGQLLSWTGSGWSRTPLPSDAKLAGTSWASVWQRGVGDIWLVAKSESSGGTETSFLLHTGEGRLGTLPGDAERRVLSQAMRSQIEDCPHPFANFLALAPFVTEEHQPPALTKERAQRLLQGALARHPGLRHLQFVSHACHGAECIGAVVGDRKEADAVRALLPANVYQRDDIRCGPPPMSEPFPVR